MKIIQFGTISILEHFFFNLSPGYCRLHH